MLCQGVCTMHIPRVILLFDVGIKEEKRRKGEQHGKSGRKIPQLRCWAVILCSTHFLSAMTNALCNLGSYFCTDHRDSTHYWSTEYLNSSTSLQQSRGKHWSFQEDLWKDVKISTATFQLVLNHAFSHKEQNKAQVSNAPGSPIFQNKKFCKAYPVVPLIGCFLPLLCLILFFKKSRSGGQEGREAWRHKGKTSSSWNVNILEIWFFSSGGTKQQIEVT